MSALLGFSRQGKSKRALSSQAGGARSALMGLFRIAAGGGLGDVSVHGR